MNRDYIGPLGDDRLVDSNGDYVRKGFYSDNNGRLVLLGGLGFLGLARSGVYYPAGPKIDFHFSKATYSTQNLTPLKDPVSFFTKNNWEDRFHWSTSLIKGILQRNLDSDETEAWEIEGRRGN
jgi:hypothetical protein